MVYYLAPLVIVLSGLLYHISQKSTALEVDPFLTLSASYAVALVLTLLAYYFFSEKTSPALSYKNFPWTILGLGVAITGLELGFLMAYRAGWDISLGALYTTSLLTMLLIPVGVWFYSELMTLHKWLGVGFCLIGLYLINFKK